MTRLIKIVGVLLACWTIGVATAARSDDTRGAFAPKGEGPDCRELGGQCANGPREATSPQELSRCLEASSRSDGCRCEGDCQTDDPGGILIDFEIRNSDFRRKK